MNLSDIDWAFVRRHTLRPSICAMIAAIALGAAFVVQQYQYKLYRNLVANQEAVHENYDNLLRQREIVDRYHRRYQQFSEMGFIGEESRLDWVEYMRTTTSALDLPTLSYSIEPQAIAASPLPPVETGDEVDIRVSQMLLQANLVHEVDLLRLFDRLQAQAPGLIKVDACSLMLADNSAAGTATPGISASCSLQLFSVITSDVRRGGMRNEMP